MRPSSHDWWIETGNALYQGAIRADKLPNGPWAIDVQLAGAYDVTLYRWAPEAPEPIHKGFLKTTKARVKIGPADQTHPVSATDTHVTFRVKVPQGLTMLQTWFTDDAGKSGGAFDVMVNRVP